MPSLIPLTLSTPSVATSPEIARRDANRIGSPALMVTQPNVSEAHLSPPVAPPPVAAFFEQAAAVSISAPKSAMAANVLLLLILPPPFWGIPQSSQMEGTTPPHTRRPDAAETPPSRCQWESLSHLSGEGQPNALVGPAKPTQAIGAANGGRWVPSSSCYTPFSRGRVPTCTYPVWGDAPPVMVFRFVRPTLRLQ